MNVPTSYKLLESHISWYRLKHTSKNWVMHQKAWCLYMPLGKRWVHISWNLARELSSLWLLTDRMIIQMFNPRYTMYNFNIHDNSSSNGSTHFRVLQTLLGTKLPSLMSQLQHIFKRSLELEMREGIQLEQGWSSLTTFEVSRRLVTCINTCVFAGPELGK